MNKLDKIKSIIDHYQTLYVVWGNMILMLIFLSYHEINYLILLLIFFTSYWITASISEITVHRYFTHRSFDIPKSVEPIFLILATLVGQGSILHWVAVHRQHHAFEDTDKDPHSPLFISKLRLYLGLYPQQNYKLSLISDLIKNSNKKYFIYEKKFYPIIWTCIWIITYLISPYFFLFIVSGSVLWFLGTSTVNCFAHNNKGQKRFVNSVAINSSILNFITGAGNHNNHHARPNFYTYSVDKEIDIYGSIIKFLFFRKKSIN
jgi:fatty-acid desaturase